MGKIIGSSLKIWYVFLLVCFSLFSAQATAQSVLNCPAYPDTIMREQQKNYFLKCFIRGDELSSITITTDGYPLVENKDGKLEYAIIDNLGKRTSTGILAKNKKDRNGEEMNLLSSRCTKYNEAVKLKSSKRYVSSSNSYSVADFPVTGTRKLLVLLIDFADLSFQISSGNFTNLMNQTNYGGSGSFKDFWLESSYGNLTVNSTIHGWYHASDSLAYYGGNNDEDEIRDVNHRELAKEAIDAAENGGVDFSEFDNDNDGYVDGVIIVHAGYGEEAGGGDNTIWAKQGTLSSSDQRTYDGVTIKDYAIVPELRFNFGSYIATIGTVCHEFGHLLGLPDLYDTNISNGDSEVLGIGG
ncbi:M6 family metalloprotease domain-containing protein [Maribellus sp. YY47]|uniref:M6 family metalloprotease domain-containing protein n=1 Tax=Maribellus sp. YY47 TaxID=2929486 RepID=UPI002000A46C|nr:M6 family metalloprotease domain-containing protein [Maribellus sp. YY47]MCK3685843.1 M6 family metalloprotease domain-containing protein [Maribellus sp. YY47]